MEVFSPLDTFVPEAFMVTQPKKFFPLNSFAPEESHPLDSYALEDSMAIQKNPITLALAITVPSPMSGMNEESKLAKFDCSTGSLACPHPMPALTLSCTINRKTPCPYALSSVTLQ